MAIRVEPGKVSVRTLTEEVRRIARAKILNPAWIDGMKEHGYKGAGEISKRVGRLYGWQATARAVDDEVFDDVTRTFMMNDENRKFLKKIIHGLWKKWRGDSSKQPNGTCGIPLPMSKTR